MNYEPNPRRDTYHDLADTNESELSIHHSIGEGPTEALSLVIAKKHFYTKTETYAKTETYSKTEIDTRLTATAWATPTLASVVDYGSGFGGPRYFKDALGIVHMKGVLKATATITSLGTLFTLPVGFRPAETLVFQVACGIGFSNLDKRLDIETTGLAYLNGTTLAVNDWVSIASVSYLAEA